MATLLSHHRRINNLIWNKSYEFFLLRLDFFILSLHVISFLLNFVSFRCYKFYSHSDRVFFFLHWIKRQKMWKRERQSAKDRALYFSWERLRLNDFCWQSTSNYLCTMRFIEMKLHLIFIYGLMLYAFSALIACSSGFQWFVSGLFLIPLLLVHI